jgi:hypothetical protein
MWLILTIHLHLCAIKPTKLFLYYGVDFMNKCYTYAKLNLNFSWMYRLGLIIHVMDKFMPECMNFSHTISCADLIKYGLPHLHV